MVDTTNLTESEFLGTQFVKDSVSKRAVILSAGTVEPSKDGSYKQLQLLVEIDGKKKLWKLNKTSLKNLQGKYGKDSQFFVGKTVTFGTTLMPNGKEGVVGNTTE
jgi:hypothetical protein